MRDKIGFILLLNTLCQKGIITEKDRENISSVDALTKLLESTQQIPPTGQIVDTLFVGLTQFAKAKTFEERIEILDEISNLSESDAVKKIVDDIADIIMKMESENGETEVSDF